MYLVMMTLQSGCFGDIFWMFKRKKICFPVFILSVKVKLVKGRVKKIQLIKKEEKKKLTANVNIWDVSETITGLDSCAIGRGVIRTAVVLRLDFTKRGMFWFGFFLHFIIIFYFIFFVVTSWQDDIIHCGQCHSSRFGKVSLLVSAVCLFYHFQCLQLLALIKKTHLGILHWVKFIVNNTVYAFVLNSVILTPTWGGGEFYVVHKIGCREQPGS